MEIERKFLVHNRDFISLSTSHKHIIQGYLSRDPERSIRIRINGDRASLNFKGATLADGMSRYEWEKEIKLTEAHELLNHCLPNLIRKTRYIIPYNQNLKWEVDVFHELNRGLVLAELEIPKPEFEIQIPDWIGKEVTHDYRYYNIRLSENPYTQWL